MIKYLALGDSLTVGFGAWPAHGFVSRYRTFVARTFHRPVVWRECARIGARAKDVLDMLRRLPPEVVTRADIVTVTAGGNDLLSAARIPRDWRDNAMMNRTLEHGVGQIRAIIQMIETAKRSTSVPYIVRIVELYDPFPAVHESAVWVRRFNRSLYQLESRTVRIAPVYERFSGRQQQLLTFDSLHPNSRGHYVIASALAQTGYGDLEFSGRTRRFK